MQLFNADPTSRTIEYEEIADLKNLEEDFVWMVYCVRDEGTYAVGLTKLGLLSECSPLTPDSRRNLWLAEYIDLSLRQSVLNDDAIPLVRDVVLWLIGGVELRDAVRSTAAKRAELDDCRRVADFEQIEPHFEEVYAAMLSAGYGPYDPIRLEEET